MARLLLSGPHAAQRCRDRQSRRGSWRESPSERYDAPGRLEQDRAQAARRSPARVPAILARTGFASEATMTSATTTTPRGTGGHHAEGRGYGLVFFAAILLLIAGFFNMIYGIAAIANSHVFTANAHYVIGNLRAWGWITLIIAVLQ